MARDESVASVRKVVWEYYRQSGRHHLPWRHTHNPYYVLVSEIMLQQTQVDRVIPYYTRFIKAFPTVAALARAPQRDVLSLWSGLGYNRRALFLHRAAQSIVCKHRGRFPRDAQTLRSLPGVGEYTAKAVCVFAYNYEEVLLETNVRAVVLHHFFKTKCAVPDMKVYPYATRLAHAQDPRLWHAALMDYGSYLKKKVPNQSRKSAHHTRQRPFRGSVRETRGAIMRLLQNHPQQLRTLHTALTSVPIAQLKTILTSLVREGFLVKRGRVYDLA